MATLFTIGFSGKKEDEFYSLLEVAGVRRLVDIRLWRAARFAPWASGANLSQRLGERYAYMQECAPTKELLGGYKNGGISWSGYEKTFAGIMRERKIERLFTAEDLYGACLLCAEKTPAMCHRRLVAEYLAEKFPSIEIEHL
jgi:uncharacterized protein (DUF488 family)